MVRKSLISGLFAILIRQIEKLQFVHIEKYTKEYP